jgi:hypothetical protein
MNLYQALQGINDKINKAAADGSYGGEQRDMLRAILENQQRIGESLLVLGGLLQQIIEDGVEIAVLPESDSTKH